MAGAIEQPSTANHQEGNILAFPLFTFQVQHHTLCSPTFIFSLYKNLLSATPKAFMYFSIPSFHNLKYITLDILYHSYSLVVVYSLLQLDRLLYSSQHQTRMTEYLSDLSLFCNHGASQLFIAKEGNLTKNLLSRGIGKINPKIDCSLSKNDAGIFRRISIF